MSSVHWIKISVNMFSSEKIKLIQALPEADAILIIWIRLIMLAGKVNSSGLILVNESLPYTPEMLATVFDKNVSIIKLALRTFQEFQMIEIQNNTIKLVNWDKYQNVKGLDEIREQDRLRKRKQREREKLLTKHEQNDTKSRDLSRDVTQQTKTKTKSKNKTKPSLGNGFNNLQKPDSLEECLQYGTEQNYNKSLVEKFYNFNENRDWRINNKSITNWKLLLDSWSERELNKSEPEQDEVYKQGGWTDED